MKTHASVLLRCCLREPIPEIAKAASSLEQAAAAHLAGNRQAAAELLEIADDPDVRAWTESLWGKGGEYAVKGPFHTTVAKQHGVAWRHKGGSHCIFVRSDGRTLPVPARRPIKPIYIRLFLALVDGE